MALLFWIGQSEILNFFLYSALHFLPSGVWFENRCRHPADSAFGCKNCAGYVGRRGEAAGRKQRTRAVPGEIPHCENIKKESCHGRTPFFMSENI